MAEKLGTRLVREGVITPAQLEEALRIQVVYGGKLGTNLVELGFLTVDVLADWLGRHTGFPAATSEALDAVAPDVLALVPADVADKFCCAPLRRDGRKLLVALAKPQDLAAIDALSFTTNLRIVPHIAPEEHLAAFHEKRYGLPRKRVVRESVQEAARRAAARAAAQVWEPPPLPAPPPGTWPGPSSDPHPTPRSFPSPLAAATTPVSSMAVTQPNLAPLRQPGTDPGPAATHRELRPVTVPGGAVTSPAMASAAPAGAPSLTPAALRPVAAAAAQTMPGVARVQVAPPAPVPIASLPSIALTPIATAPVAPPAPAPPERGRGMSAPPPAPAPPERSRGMSGAPPAPAASPAAVTSPSMPPVAAPGAPTTPAPVRPAIPASRPHRGLSLQEAAVLLAAASSREDVVDTIVRFAQGLCDSVMVFTVREGMALGWRGAGAQVPAEVVESIMLPLNAPSLFKQAVDGGAPAAGAMPDTTLHRHLLKALRRETPPRSMAIVPVLLLDRTVNLIYVDRLQSGDIGESLAPLVELASRVSLAYQRIVRESKVKKTGK